MPQQHAAHYRATDRLQELLIQVYRLYNSELARMNLAVSTQSLEGRRLLNLPLSRLYQTLLSNQSDVFFSFSIRNLNQNDARSASVESTLLN